MVCLTFTWTVEYIEELWFGIHCFITDLCVLWCACVYMSLLAVRGQRMSSIIFHPISLRQDLSVNQSWLPFSEACWQTSPETSLSPPTPLHLIDKCVAVLTSLNRCFKSEHGPSFLCSKFFYPLSHLSVTLSGLSLRDLSASISLLGLEECITTRPFGASWGVLWLSRPMRQNFLLSTKLLSPCPQLDPKNVSVSLLKFNSR